MFFSVPDFDFPVCRNQNRAQPSFLRALSRRYQTGFIFADLYDF
jgi:hypothetical protein